MWSPDDSRVAFSSSREAMGEIWVRPTSGQGAAEKLFTAGTNITLTDWSMDGRLVFFDYLQLGDNSNDAWVLDVETREATPLVTGPFEQQGAALSPDGTWLAFVSDESGTAELYVQSFPDADGRFMVSSDGGAQGAFSPVWRPDGRAVYYNRVSLLMTVPVTPGDDFPFGTPRRLFGTNLKSGQSANYQVTDEGRRILSNELPPVDPSKAGARLIQNWWAGLGIE